MTFDELLSAKEKIQDELTHLVDVLKQRVSSMSERIEEFNKQKAEKSFKIDKPSVIKTGTRLVLHFSFEFI